MTNLSKIIKSEFLPFINKPGRFLGNELGAICHPFDDRISVALAYPDLYDLGMSNLGLSILYNIVNNSDNGKAERVFAMTDDAADILRQKNIPLFSLESKTPVKEFDLLGFNSATELNYTNILAMLDLASIPLLTKDRTESDPLIVIGGGCAFNPEPLANFCDLFFIGDAEEGLLDIINTLQEHKNHSRLDKLKALAQIDGVCVPSFYKPEYDDNGKFLKLEILHENVPQQIQARTIKQIKNENYPDQPIVPSIETVHDRLAVEIMRGCGHSCRFCQATVLYKPARVRSVDEIVGQVTANLEKTGYDQVTLLSLSSGDHPEIEALIKKLAGRLKNKRIALALPSLRISTLSLELAGLITSNQKSGLTFAPEAGTDRLRKVINKALDEETLLTVLEEAFERGWQTIKLYFMIGLPTETDDDLLGIVELIKKMCRVSDKYRGKRNFNITISPFAPKSHTPWQWERQISIQEIEKKRDFLKHHIRNRNVRLKFHNPQTTWLEGVLGRGDRKLGRVIARAYSLGAHMDGWSESFNFETWQRAFELENIDPNKYLTERSTSDSLPWDHIRKGLSKTSLIKELAKSRGLMDVIKSLDNMPENPLELPKAKPAKEKNQISYGRSPKTVKAVSNMSVPNSRLRIKWGRQNLARFLSHLDNMRSIERAMRRANLPIAFSQGFRPHPKFSFGPPLALGLTSESEYLDVQLDTPLEETMLSNLARQFPPDFSLLGTKSVLGKASSLAAKLNLAEYEVEIPLPANQISEKIDLILNSESFLFNRITKNGPVEIEGRSAIMELSASPISESSCILNMKTGMADLGFVKPNELLEHGFKITGDDLQKLHIHRKNLWRLENGKYIDPFDII